MQVKDVSNFLVSLNCKYNRWCLGLNNELLKYLMSDEIVIYLYQESIPPVSVVDCGTNAALQTVDTLWRKTDVADRKL